MRTLKIYYTSDVHGYLYPTSYGDTKEKAMGLFQCADAYEKGEDTLIIDGGDMIQGSAWDWYANQVLSSPVSLAEAMNECGYDYYVLGNHDFNYGLSYQEAYRKANHATCLCQNVTDEKGEVLYPYVVRQMPNGLRVGLVGIVTDFINVWEKKENLAGILVTDPFRAAQKALAQMKGQADLTICIYHGGFEADLSTGKRLSNTTENVGYRICRELDFDILLTGHQHISVDGQSVHGTWVVQPLDQGKEYDYLEVTLEEGECRIHSERRVPQLPKKESEERTCYHSTGMGEYLRQKFQPLEDEVQKWLDRPAGHLSRALLPGDKVEMALFGCPIADFLNRIQLYYSGAQISCVGLANEVAGFRKEVSTRDILATYPYPNTFIVCEITGKRLKAAMERSAEYFSYHWEKGQGIVGVADSFLIPKVEHYNYDYFMGVDYEIHPERPVGERIVGLSFKGIPVREEDTFTLCLNNYRYGGAGGYPMYPQCPIVREINLEMVELIRDYFRKFPEVEV